MTKNPSAHSYEPRHSTPNKTGRTLKAGVVSLALAGAATAVPTNAHATSALPLIALSSSPGSTPFFPVHGSTGGLSSLSSVVDASSHAGSADLSSTYG